MNSKKKDKNPPLILVMGVSGCGKSTVGKGLSKALDIAFIEADDFHPASNLKKMQKGIPLHDEDRLPWLKNLAIALQRKENEGAVLACSALKEKYRGILKSLITKDLKIIFLNGSFEKIKERMERRSDHFMPSALLKSQFDSLDIPTIAWTFDIENSPEDIIAVVLEKLNQTK